MKTWMAMTASLFLLMAGSPSQGQDFPRIGFDVENGEARYTYQLKKLTSERLAESLQRIGKYNMSATVLVVPTERVTASDLLGLLLTMRECGVRNILVSSPARRNGAEGRITIAMDVSRDVFYGDAGPENVVGFRSSTDDGDAFDEFLDLNVNSDEIDWSKETTPGLPLPEPK